jgi:hypothetical protein
LHALKPVAAKMGLTATWQSKSPGLACVGGILDAPMLSPSLPRRRREGLDP